MKLIDLGNTRAKIYDDLNNNSIEIASNKLLEYLQNNIEPTVICSVVPKYNQEILKMKHIYLITNKDYSIVFDNSDKLQSKGADRIIACLGARKLYGENVIVIDMGTCVTIDVIKGREYVSGYIYPGFDMLESLLYEKIEQLPTPQYDEGSIETSNQIYWANIYGFIGSVKAMIESIENYIDYRMVITGGTVRKFANEYEIDIVEELRSDNIIKEHKLMRTGMREFEIILKNN